MNLILSLPINRIIYPTSPLTGKLRPVEIEFVMPGLPHPLQLSETIKSRISSNVGTVKERGLKIGNARKAKMLSFQLNGYIPETRLTSSGCVRSDKKGKIGPWHLTPRHVLSFESQTRCMPVVKKESPSQENIALVVLETPVEAGNSLKQDSCSHYVSLVFGLSGLEHDGFFEFKSHHLVRIDKIWWTE